MSAIVSKSWPAGRTKRMAWCCLAIGYALLMNLPHGVADDEHFVECVGVRLGAVARSATGDDVIRRIPAIAVFAIEAHASFGKVAPAVAAQLGEQRVVFFSRQGKFSPRPCSNLSCAAIPSSSTMLNSGFSPATKFAPNFCRTEPAKSFLSVADIACSHSRVELPGFIGFFPDRLSRYNAGSFLDVTAITAHVLSRPSWEVAGILFDIAPTTSSFAALIDRSAIETKSPSALAERKLGSRLDDAAATASLFCESFPHDGRNHIFHRNKSQPPFSTGGRSKKEGGMAAVFPSGGST